MPQFSIANYLTAFATFAIAIFVFMYNRKSPINRIFCAYSLCISEWSFFTAIHAMTNNHDLSFFFARMMHIGVALIPILFFHFCLKILDIFEQHKAKILAGYTASIFFIITNFTTTLLIPRVRPKLGYNYFMDGGTLYPFLIVYFAIYVIFALNVLVRAYATASGNKKNQLKYLLLGSVFGYVFGISSFFPVYDITAIPYPFGSYAIILYVVITAYAIVRHQLMDIEVIIKKTLVFAGLFTAVYAIFAGFTFLGQVVFEEIMGGNRWISLVPGIAVIIFILRPLDNYLISVTDRYLFQKSYDYKKLLKTFTNEVLTVLDIGKLVKLTVDTLANGMKIEACGILLLNEEKNEFRLAAGIGISKKETIFDMSNTLIAFLGRTKLYLSIKDQGENSRIPDRIMHDMNRLKLELAIPLIIHEEMIGILTLGKKKSDEPYTEDDMDILIPLSRTLSIAINNAEMFEELGKTQAEAAQREKMAVIGTLAAGINHEICNPLGIARGQCEVYLLNSNEGLYNDRSTEEQIYEAKQIMQKVIKETDRATAITKKLSSFARPGSGEVSEDVSISHEIDEVMALIGHDLKLENINFTKDIPADLPSICADKKQIQEIFFNLIRNAGQAIEGTGKITVRARKNNHSITVDIEDTGHGIAPDKLEQIFNPFYTTKAPGKGTGLGLFIVRQIVRRNKGSISVKSKVGEGTTFTLEFELPKGAA